MQGDAGGRGGDVAAAVFAVEIDLNVRVRGGQTFAGFEDVRTVGLDPTEALPRVGDSVLATQTEDESQFDATVTGLDHDRRLIYLAVDWSSGRDFFPWFCTQCRDWLQWEDLDPVWFEAGTQKCLMCAKATPYPC